MTERTTTGQRRQKRTRQSILDAALELTGARGVDGWSMRELATEVDYTAGALYRYYDSKASLLGALTASAEDELGARLTEVEDDGSPLNRLTALALAYLSYAADEPTRFKLLLVHTPSQRVSLDQAPQATSPYAVLLAAVHDALGTGALSATDTFGAEEIAYAIWATAHGMAVLEQTHLAGFDADFASIHIEVIQRLLAGLVTHP